MSVSDRWLLPDGVEELLPAEAWRMEALRRRVLDLFERHGYDLVVPPLIEYLESLLTGTGNDLDLSTFKLTDQLSGRLMGVRADMTPQVARIDAHRLNQETPSRLCYVGPTLRTRPEGVGASRSPLQVGAELYGHAGIESDREVIALMLAMLRAAGAQEIHLDLGHVEIYRALMQQLALPADAETELFDALQRKANAEIRGLVERLNLPQAQSDALCALPSLFGAADAVLERARKVVLPLVPQIESALHELQGLAADLRTCLGVSEIHLDLAELRGYQYHTGVVFAAYVPGQGQAVALGGRYDHVGEVFGRARPATGFSSDLRTLLALDAAAASTLASGEGHTYPRAGIFAPASRDAALLVKMETLRAEGLRVVQALPGQIGDAAAMGCNEQLVQDGSKWKVVAL